MKRITLAMLESLVNQINIEAGTPLNYTNKLTGKINIGHYHLDMAYGGHRLVQTVSEGGGIRTISTTGYTTKRELFNELHMFLRGLQAKNEDK